MRKKMIYVTVAVLSLLAVGSLLWARETLTYKSISMFAMDTFCTVKYKGAQYISPQMEACIQTYDKAWDAYRDGSAVHRANRTGMVRDAELSAFTEALYSYYEKTEGAFDFTLKDLSTLWGFETQNPQVPSDVSKACYGADKLVFGKDGILLNGTELDFGGVAKGYVTDRLVEILKENQCTDAVLDLGGNIYSVGTHTIGIKMPTDDTSDIALSLSVTDKAVITSGVYQRYFVDENGTRWHHIFDPKTGYPVKNDILSVTVIGESATACDILSTAFMVMGKEKAFSTYKNYGDVELIVMTADAIFCSAGIYPSIGNVNNMYKEVRIFDV